METAILSKVKVYKVDWKKTQGGADFAILNVGVNTRQIMKGIHAVEYYNCIVFDQFSLKRLNEIVDIHDYVNLTLVNPTYKVYVGQDGVERMQKTWTASVVEFDSGVSEKSKAFFNNLRAQSQANAANVSTGGATPNTGTNTFGGNTGGTPVNNSAPAGKWGAPSGAPTGGFNSKTTNTGGGFGNQFGAEFNDEEIPF